MTGRSPPTRGAFPHELALDLTVIGYRRLTVDPQSIVGLQAPVWESSLRKRIQMAIFAKICDPVDTTPGSIAAGERPVVNRGRC